ncbi:uncharacterized protein [Prorops nasuta]|uniref:uncharacterized protein n=1 Tax=Prorops nasuta TaxID=863751 RepID=UPI0034CDE082
MLNVLVCFRLILNYMTDDWSLEYIEEELAIKEAYAQKGWKISQLLVVMSFTQYIMFMVATPFIPKIIDMIMPLNETRKPTLFFKAYYIVDEEKYFALLMFYNLLVITVVMCFAIGNQAAFWIILQHLCGMAAVLGYRLQNIFPKNAFTLQANKQDRTPFKEGCFYKSIVLCVQRHNQISKFTKLVNAYYLPASLSQLFFFVIYLGSSFLQFFDPQLRDYISVSHLYYAVIFMVINCYIGQVFINLMDELSNQIFFTKWYDCPPASQKIVLMLIRCYNVPHGLSIYKIFYLSFSSLKMVIQSATSYFLIFKKVKYN